MAASDRPTTSNSRLIPKAVPWLGPRWTMAAWITRFLVRGVKRVKAALCYALPRYQRLIRKADALIASINLAGTNTR
jgi:hypothetical protein